MEKPVLVERYGRMVWETPEMDKLRRDNCMCLFCDKLNIAEPDKNCTIASRFFADSREHGIAHIVTRCDSFEPKKA
jgi:hypothetical protein